MDHASDRKQKGSSAMSRAPSGAQFHLSAGSQRATIVEVGGGIREYVVDGRDVLDPYPLGATCDGAHGAPLVPWPNRLADGAYSFDGNRYQLAINEPDKHNAIHGLLRWRNWQAIEHEPDRVFDGNSTSSAHWLSVPPRRPDRVRTEVRPALASPPQRPTRGRWPAPTAVVNIPTCRRGPALIDTCTLQLEAASWVDTANDRQLPTGTRATAGTPFGLLRCDSTGQAETGHTVLRSGARFRPACLGHPHCQRRDSRRALGRQRLRVHRALHRRHPRREPTAAGSGR